METIDEAELSVGVMTLEVNCEQRCNVFLFRYKGSLESKFLRYCHLDCPNVLETLHCVVIK